MCWNHAGQWKMRHSLHLHIGLFSRSQLQYKMSMEQYVEENGGNNELTLDVRTINEILKTATKRSESGDGNRVNEVRRKNKYGVVLQGLDRQPRAIQR